MYEFTNAPMYGVFTTMGTEHPLGILIPLGGIVLLAGIITKMYSEKKVGSKIGVSLVLFGIGIALIGVAIQKPTQVVDTTSVHQEVEKDGMVIPKGDVFTAWVNMLNGPSGWDPSPCLMLENRAEEKCADFTEFYPVEDSKGERFYVRATASGKLWYLDEKGTYHNRETIASVVSAEKIKESVEETTVLKAVNIEKEEYTFDFSPRLKPGDSRFNSPRH